MGKVQSIRKRAFYGHQEATYAQLYFKRDNLTLTLLERDLPKTVRSLMSADKAAKLLEHIGDWDGKAKPHWKARDEAHRKAIEGGNPIEYARVAKELTRLEKTETLRPRDKAHLAQSLRLLKEELSKALQKTPVVANKLIREALNESAA